MSKMKKVMVLLMAAVMVACMSLTAFAATGVTAEEQKILDEATAKAKELGVDTTNSKKFKDTYAQAESYLAQAEPTTEQIDALVKTVDECATTAKTAMSENGAVKLSDLSDSVLSSVEDTVMTTVKESAAKVGITISFAKNADGSISYKASVPTAEGSKTVATNDTVVKQTGSNLSTTVVVAAMLVGAVAVCGVVASKKRFAEEA